MSVAAVFDVDRTLLPGTTAERLFVRRLWRERLLGWRQALAGLLFSLQRLGPTLLADWRAQRPYLVGLDHDHVVALARQCFLEDVRPRLARQGVARLRAHRATGALTVLLSGSLAELIQPMAADLGVDIAIASQVRVREGRVAGGLVDLHPYGVAKAALVQRLVRERALHLPASYCYADHHTDEPLLRLFGHPVCVNPSERLRLLARRNGWPVEEFV
ncbi:MAG: HAD-IB family hydrolase [Chloroflexi bacterium]|nr:HAD-IB family hydrolase [Chloroflexota bacterium]